MYIYSNKISFIKINKIRISSRILTLFCYYTYMYKNVWKNKHQTINRGVPVEEVGKSWHWNTFIFCFIDSFYVFIFLSGKKKKTLIVELIAP